MNWILKTSVLSMFLFLAACGSKKDNNKPSEPTLEERAAGCAAPYQTPTVGTQLDMKSFFAGRNGKWDLRKLELYQETKDSKAYAYIGFAVNFDRSFKSTFVPGCSGQPGADVNGTFSYAIPAELNTDRARYESEIQGKVTFNPQKGEPLHTSVVDRKNVPFSFEVKPGKTVSAQKLEDNSVEVLISVTETNSDGMTFRSFFKANYIQVPKDREERGDRDGRDDRDGRGGRGDRGDRDGQGDNQGPGSDRDDRDHRGDRDDRGQQDEDNRPATPVSEELLKEARKYATTRSSAGGLGLLKEETEAFVERLKKMPDWLARNYLQVHRKTFLFATSPELAEHKLDRKTAIRLADLIAGKRQAEQAFDKFTETYKKAARRRWDKDGLGLSRAEAYEMAQKAIADMPNRRLN